MKKKLILVMCVCALIGSTCVWSHAETPSKQEPNKNYLKPLTKDQALEIKKNTEKRCNDLKNEIGRTCPDPRKTGPCHRAQDELKLWKRGGGCR